MGYILHGRTRSESCRGSGFKTTIQRSRNDKRSGIGAVWVFRVRDLLLPAFLPPALEAPAFASRVWGLEFGVWGLGLGVEGLGSGVWGYRV